MDDANRIIESLDAIESSICFGVIEDALAISNIRMEAIADGLEGIKGALEKLAKHIEQNV